MPQAALALAVWVGSSAAFAASAIGAGTALAAGVGFATIGATLAAEVYAVNAATSALTPKIKDPGRTLQWQADPRAGIPYPMGRCATAGKIVFNQSAPATSRKYLNFVTVYSGVPADAFEAFQANGVTVAFTADSGEGASGYYLNRMWLKSQLGHEFGSWLHWTATGSKDTPANHGGMPTEWTSEHLTTGYAATLWGMEYDTARFSSGVPTPRMVGRWAKTYDPRQDSTYPGGSGAHRWDDESTWTWSRCPYRNGLSWAIGRHNGGQLVLGLGYDIEEIDVASFVHGMNVSDANAWTMGGLVDSDDHPWEALKAILQAGAGYPILGGTQLSVMVNAPAVSVATLTEADIVGAITVPAQVSANDRINTVWPSYTEEALDWQVVTPDAPVQVAEYVTLDGEERSIPLGMPLLQDATQVGQLCRYAIEDARELSGIVLACKPWTQWIAPGLCVTANIPSAGLNGQKLRVQKRKRDPMSMVVTFIARTETDGKHAYALGQTNTPPDTPALTGGDPSVVPAPDTDDWVATGATLTDNGVSIPAIVFVGEVSDPQVAQLLVHYRPDGATDWISGPVHAITDDEEVRIELSSGLTPDTTYNLEIAYRSVRGVVSAWTALDDVVAGSYAFDTMGTEDGLLTVYYQNDAPTTPERGDVWFDTNAGNAPWQWDGLTWIDASNNAAVQAIQFATAAQATANTKILTFYQTSAPTASAVGDLWVDTDDANRRVYRWNGSSWLVIADQTGFNISAGFTGQGALATLSAVTWATQVTGVGKPDDYATKSIVYKQFAAPSSPNVNDIWLALDGGGNPVAMYAWNGSAWVSGADKTALNIAAGVTGQGALATLSFVDWATKVTGVGKPADYATKSVVYKQTSAPGSPSTNDVWIRTDGSGNGLDLWVYNGSSWISGADRTPYNVAMGITGQGPWATASVPSGLTPSVVGNRTQYLDGNGQVYSYRGLYWGYSIDGVAGRYTSPLSSDVGAASCAAHTVYLYRQGYSSGYPLSISGHTASGLADNTNYTWFYRPDYGDHFCVYSGYAPAYVSSQDGYMLIGEIKTPASSGYYVPPGETAPDPGTSFDGRYDEFRCVAVSAFLASGQVAGEAKAGDALTLMAPAGDRVLPGTISAFGIGDAECLTFTTALGAVLTVSESTPIMTRKGAGFVPRAVRATDAAVGLPVPILTEAGDLVWDEIAAIAPAGRRSVARISAQGIGVFAASDSPSGPRLFTHNMWNKVPA